MESTIIVLGPGHGSGLLRHQLHVSRYSVAVMPSAADAVQAALRCIRPLVIQVVPSGATAEECLRSFREIPSSARLPLLILGADMFDAPPELQQLQPFSFLVYPCAPSPLLREIQYLIELSNETPAGGEANRPDEESGGDTRFPTWINPRMGQTWVGLSLEQPSTGIKNAPTNCHFSLIG